MIDNNELIDNKYWVHWRLSSHEWNSFAMMRIEKEKETAEFLFLFLIIVIIIIVMLTLVSRPINIIFISVPLIACLIAWLRFKSNCSTYSREKTTVDIYIGPEESSINRKTYSYRGRVLQESSVLSNYGEINSIELIFRNSAYQTHPEFSIYFPIPRGNEEIAEEIVQRFRQIYSFNG